MDMKRFAFILSGFLFFALGVSACGGGYGGGSGGGGSNSRQVVSIMITPAKDTTIASGDTQQFKAAAKNSAGSTVSAQVAWHSSDPAVATISGAGLVTAVDAGTTTITATINQSSVYSNSMTITSNAVKLTVEAASMMMGVASLSATPESSALIIVHDSGGNMQATMTDTSGHFALSVGGMTPPFLMKARDQGRILFSAGMKPGVVNVNSATDLLVRAWLRANGMTAETAFSQPHAFAGLDAETLEKLSDALEIALQLSPDKRAAAMDSLSFFTTPIAANGAGLDRFLEQLQTSVTDSTLTIRNAAGREIAVRFGARQSATLRVQPVSGDSPDGMNVKLLPVE